MNISFLRYPLLGATLLLAAGCSGGGDEANDKAGVSVGGSTQRANTYTLGDQQNPSVARNSNGDSVVVWDSADGQDGSLGGVFGQRFKNGVPQGGEFQVNTFTNNKQNLPSVSMDAAGNFVVVWRSSGQDSNGGTIYGQRFLANGTRAGAEFQIGPNDSDFDSQADPSVAMNEAGKFVVAFSNRELNSLALFLEVLSAERRDVQVRAYNADGTAATDVIEVASSTSTIERSPVIGIAANGDFAVSWISDGSPARIMTRRYAADGTAKAEAVQVNDSVSANDRPYMAMATTGKYVVTWERLVDQAPLIGIYARVYGIDGAPVTEQFQVSGPGAGMMERTSVGMAADGSFVVGGQARQQANDGGGFFIQAYGPNAAPVGGTQRMSDAGFFGMFGRVAVDPAGGVSLAWQTFKQDGSGRGIYFR